MSEVEMLGLSGVAIIGVYLLVRAVLNKGRNADESDLASVDGDGATD